MCGSDSDPRTGFFLNDVWMFLYVVSSPSCCVSDRQVWESSAIYVHGVILSMNVEFREKWFSFSLNSVLEAFWFACNFAFYKFSHENLACPFDVHISGSNYIELTSFMQQYSFVALWKIALNTFSKVLLNCFYLLYYGILMLAVLGLSANTWEKQL